MLFSAKFHLCSQSHVGRMSFELVSALTLNRIPKQAWNCAGSCRPISQRIAAGAKGSRCETEWVAAPFSDALAPAPPDRPHRLERYHLHWSIDGFGRAYRTRAYNDRPFGPAFRGAARIPVRSRGFRSAVTRSAVFMPITFSRSCLSRPRSRRRCNDRCIRCSAIGRQSAVVRLLAASRMWGFECRSLAYHQQGCSRTTSSMIAVASKQSFQLSGAHSGSHRRRL
jgi:hypothetical protein